MNRYNKKYLFNFFIWFIGTYIILSFLNEFFANTLSFILANLINGENINNIIYLNNGTYNIYAVEAPCTGAFSLSLFLGYILGTPNVPIKNKLIYSTIGLIILILTNILRMSIIVEYTKNNMNYWLFHDIFSFILFPVVVVLNIIWIIYLNNKKYIQ